MVNVFPEDAKTLIRIERSARPFRCLASTRRFIASPVDDLPGADRLHVRDWAESTTGDLMHKLVLVESGYLDLEGESGGWLVIPGHLVFIPAQRAFNIMSQRADLLVVHLHPGDAEWIHHGCWVTCANGLAIEMVRLAHALPREEISASAGARCIFRSISYLCREWFTNQRMLWLPSAKTDEMRAAVRYVRSNIDSASLAGASRAAGLSQRTFQRRCEAEFGFSWRNLLREARIMYAMELLCDRERTAAAIARATGFRTLAAFTTSFSERTGMTPSEFRKRFGEAARLRQ